jgi:hypothetical protein
VYFLISGSIKALEATVGAQKTNLRKIYREKIRSQSFIGHSLLIADYFLYLQKQSLKTGSQLHFFTKTDLSTHRYLLKPLPSAYFARVDKDNKVKRYFLEVVDEGAPRFVLRKRLEQYNDYIESGNFEEATKHPFPIVLFICLNTGSLIYLKKHLARVIEETSLSDTSIYLATKEGAFVGHWEKAEAEDE